MARSRTPLSRERVLRAAIRLADKRGVEALSMRKLGRELGVEAMSLYEHVANKDAILDGIVEMVVSEIGLPGAGVDWKAAMRRRAMSVHAVLLRHPWASTLMESRMNLGPARVRYADAVLGTLRSAGFGIEIAYNAFLAIDSYVYGFTLQEVNWPFEAEERAEAVAAVRAQISDEYPHLREVTEYVMQRKGPVGYALEFELGLDIILDGFEKLLPTQPILKRPHRRPGRRSQ